MYALSFPIDQPNPDGSVKWVTLAVSKKVVIMVDTRGIVDYDLVWTQYLGGGRERGPGWTLEL